MPMAAVLSSVMAQPSRAVLLRKPSLRAQRLSTLTVPQALNKTEFTAAVKDNIESTPAIQSLTNSDFDKIVSGVFDTITDTVADGESITITGFGKFERRERKARTGRNPQTQQPLEIPATVTPGFTPGKSFKDTVKAGKDGGGAATRKAAAPKAAAKQAAAPKARFGTLQGSKAGEETTSTAKASTTKQAPKDSAKEAPKAAPKAAPKMRFGRYIQSP